MLQLERADRVESLEYQIVREWHGRVGPPAHQGDCQETDADRGRGAGVDPACIGHLEPKPGREYLPDTEQYVVPEVFIRRGDDGEWKATSNHEHVPGLRISNAYKDLMAQAATSSEVRDYIRDKICSRKFLIKSIHQRQSTIVNIANEILTRQRVHGSRGVPAPTDDPVAGGRDVGVHETTVSRAVSGKYIETPHGVLEMKYFFTRRAGFQ